MDGPIAEDRELMAENIGEWLIRIQFFDKSSRNHLDLFEKISLSTDKHLTFISTSMIFFYLRFCVALWHLVDNDRREIMNMVVCRKKWNANLNSRRPKMDYSKNMIEILQDVHEQETRLTGSGSSSSEYSLSSSSYDETLICNGNTWLFELNCSKYETFVTTKCEIIKNT